MSIAQRSITSVSWNVVVSIVQVVVGFVRSALLARLLPVEIFGIYGMAGSIVGLSVVPADFGMAGALIPIVRSRTVLLAVQRSLKNCVSRQKRATSVDFQPFWATAQKSQATEIWPLTQQLVLHRASETEDEKQAAAVYFTLSVTFAKEPMIRLGYDFDTPADWQMSRFFRYRDVLAIQVNLRKVKTSRTEMASVLSSLNHLIKTIIQERKQEWMHNQTQ